MKSRIFFRTCVVRSLVVGSWRTAPEQVAFRSMLHSEDKDSEFASWVLVMTLCNKDSEIKPCRRWRIPRGG